MPGSPGSDLPDALIVWHDHDRRRNAPVAVELSYRYGDEEERYGGIAARRAFDAFQAIQTRLDGWVDPHAMTKTAHVYDRPSPPALDV